MYIYEEVQAELGYESKRTKADKVINDTSRPRIFGLDTRRIKILLAGQGATRGINMRLNNNHRVYPSFVMTQNGRGIRYKRRRPVLRETGTTGSHATYAMAERMQIRDRCQMQKMVCKKEMLLKG